MSWKPAVTDWGIDKNTVPEITQYITMRDRKSYRVAEIRDIHPANWEQADTDAHTAAGKPDPWPLRPRRLVVLPLGKGQNPTAETYRIHPWSKTQEWWPMPESWPICIDCRQVWPCKHAEAQRYMEALFHQADLRLSMPTGVCWACTQPLVDPWVIYPGENLLAPSMPPPSFHADKDLCRKVAVLYEGKWLSQSDKRDPILTHPAPTSEQEAGSA